MQSVIVYGKSVCPNCDTAKQLLESKSIEFTYIDLEQDMTSFFKFRGLGIREVPVIEVDGELVNLADLRKLLASQIICNYKQIHYNRYNYPGIKKK